MKRKNSAIWVYLLILGVLFLVVREINLLQSNIEEKKSHFYAHTVVFQESQSRGQNVAQESEQNSSLSVLIEKKRELAVKEEEKKIPTFTLPKAKKSELSLYEKELLAEVSESVEIVQEQEKIVSKSKEDEVMQKVLANLKRIKEEQESKDSASGKEKGSIHSIKEIRKRLSTLLQEASSVIEEGEFADCDSQDKLQEQLCLKRKRENAKKMLKELAVGASRLYNEQNAKYVANLLKEVSTATISVVKIAQSETTVVVNSGDTLSSLALRIYGDMDRYVDIFEANRDKLDNPNQLLVGMELRIPMP